MHQEIEPQASNCIINVQASRSCVRGELLLPVATLLRRSTPVLDADNINWRHWPFSHRRASLRQRVSVVNEIFPQVCEARLYSAGTVLVKWLSLASMMHKCVMWWPFDQDQKGPKEGREDGSSWNSCKKTSTQGKSILWILSSDQEAIISILTWW